MLSYILLGIIFAWVMELLIHNNWNPKVPSFQKIHFTSFERLVMVVFWPIWLVRIIVDKLTKRN